MVDYFYASDSIHYINKKRTLFNFFKKKSEKKNIIISGLLTNLHEFVFRTTLLWFLDSSEIL